MGAHDFQLGFKNESVFNTAVTVDRFFEYNSNVAPIKPVAARTQGDPLRVGSRARRKSRAVPYTSHCEGSVEFDVMTLGFGYFLQHMLGNVATTGSGPYTHTGTEGTSSALIGKSFTTQLNYPFHPSGTNQAFTFSGGKIPSWGLANTVDGMLVLSLNLWFAAFTTATALATPAYPSNMEPYSWAGGRVTVGGVGFDVTNASVDVNNNLMSDRRQIRQNTTAKEPTPGVLDVSWAIEADYDSLTQFNRVHSQTISGMYASLEMTWVNSTSSITVTIPDARFDDFEFGGDRGGIAQSFTGVGENGSSGPISVAYVTSESTP